MTTLTTIFTIFIVLAAIALILVVLVQKSKGGGLSAGFSSSNSILGVSKTTDAVEKMTWGLAGFIIVMSIVVVMITPKAKEAEIQVDAPNMPTNTTPEMPGSIPMPALPNAEDAGEATMPLPVEE